MKMRTVSRIILDNEMKKIIKRKIKRKGVVLDVGSKDSPYKKLIPHKEYSRMDISDKHNPDIVGDILDKKTIQKYKSYFDTIVFTEVLEHIQEPQMAVNNINYILKEGGHCILSTRFIQPIHPGPKDYFRFTEDSLRYLFRDYRDVEVYPLGNVTHSIWQLINFRGKNLLSPLMAKINFHWKSKCPTGYIVFAEK